MIKLAQTQDWVYVKVTKPEFRLLAKTAANNIPEDGSVDISWIGTITSFSGSQKAALTKAKQEADAFSTTLTGLINNAGN